MITKSRYVKFMECPRLYFLDEEGLVERAPISDFQQMNMESGNEVGALARNYFGSFKLIERASNIEMAEKTKEAINNHEHIICEASFIYNDCFCAVDVLKVDSDGVEIYEVKSTTTTRPSYYHDCSFQNYVLSSLGYNVKGVYLLYINNKYIFKDTLDLKQYFNCLKMDLFEKKEIEENLNQLRLLDKEPVDLVTPNCKVDCPYFKHCFKDLPKQNIYNLSGLQNKYKLYKDGIVSYDDFMNAGLKETPTFLKCVQQIHFETYDEGIKINKEMVNNFINTFEYPLYYLDFETIRDVVPFINDTNPEFVRVVQYSLHIENEEGGELIHKEYLQERKYDNLEEVADKLIEDLGTKGTILTYNQSFEKGRIQALAKLVKDENKKKALESIISRIKDLEVPFKNRWIFCREMIGKSSIKKVLPALCPDSENAYKDLPLAHNGTDAMRYYNELIVVEGARHEEIKEGLLLYCGLDTMAMVDIMKRIRELLK